MRASSVAALWLACAATAWAQDIQITGPLTGSRIDPGLPYRRASSLEATTSIGLVDIGRAGVGLLGYGYAHEGGPIGALDARAMFATSSEWHSGFLVRFAHTAGDSFGTLSQYGFLHLVFEVAAVLRYALHMYRLARHQAFLGMHLGLAGSYDDAGLGNGPTGAMPAERLAASRTLDHGSVGAVLGADFDGRCGPLVMGIGIQIRALYGIDSPISLVAMFSVAVRMGVVLDFDHGAT